jgi:hypothetical protein
MLGKLITTCAAAFTVTLVWAAAVYAQVFDGVWNVTVYTTNGHCGVTSWQIGIIANQVYVPTGTLLGGYPAGLAGIVTTSGRLRVNGLAGPRSGRASGRLFAYQGSGTWAGVGPSGTCSGVWSAARYY